MFNTSISNCFSWDHVTSSHVISCLFWVQGLKYCFTSTGLGDFFFCIILGSLCVLLSVIGEKNLYLILVDDIDWVILNYWPLFTYIQVVRWQPPIYCVIVIQDGCSHVVLPCGFSVSKLTTNVFTAAGSRFFKKKLL